MNSSLLVVNLISVDLTFIKTIAYSMCAALKSVIQFDSYACQPAQLQSLQHIAEYTCPAIHSYTTMTTANYNMTQEQCFGPWSR